MTPPPPKKHLMVIRTYTWCSSGLCYLFGGHTWWNSRGLFWGVGENEGHA